MKMTTLSLDIARILVVALGLVSFGSACAHKEREPARNQPPARVEPEGFDETLRRQHVLEEPSQLELEEPATMSVRLVPVPPGAPAHAQPKPGEDATVEVTVENFDLVEPDENDEAVENEGHLRYQLDSQGPVVATTATKLGFHGMTPGRHEIVVFLVGNDATPIGPRQSVIIGDETEAQPAGEGAAAEPSPTPNQDVTQPERAKTSKKDQPEDKEPVAGHDAPAVPAKPPEGVALAASLVDAEELAKKHAVTVEVDADGIDIVDPGATGLVPQTGQGHYHFQLDNGPIVATTGGKLSFFDLAPGGHTIKVFLAGNDHQPLGVEQTLQVNIP